MYDFPKVFNKYIIILTFFFSSPWQASPYSAESLWVGHVKGSVFSRQPTTPSFFILIFFAFKKRASVHCISHTMKRPAEKRKGLGISRHAVWDGNGGEFESAGLVRMIWCRRVMGSGWRTFYLRQESMYIKSVHVSRGSNLFSRRRVYFIYLL